MNKKILALLAVFSLLAYETNATRGVDISQPYNNFQCFKNNGIDFVITRAWKSYGDFDSSALSNIQNARNAGINYVDIYLFPCRGQSATVQVNNLVSRMGNANYGMIWLDIETNPSGGCSWTQASGSSNCQYVTELVNAIRAKGKVPGIYATYYMW